MIRKHPVKLFLERLLGYFTNDSKLAKDAQYSSGKVVPSYVPELELCI